MHVIKMLKKGESIFGSVNNVVTFGRTRYTRRRNNNLLSV